MRVEITTAWTSHYPDPVQFDAGAEIQVERGDAEYPGWYWCRVPSGKEGWVHQSFLSATAGTVTALETYTARELTVCQGVCGDLMRVLDGWAWIRLETGDEGWIPESHVRPIPSDPSGGGETVPRE